jgi:hypothetical protein
MQKHPVLSNFYYYPFGNIDEIFEDFKRIISKTTLSSISYDEITSKSIYQKLDKIVKKYMILSQSNQIYIYNPCYKDFNNYTTEEEFKNIPDEYKKNIKNLSNLNNCNWKQDLAELNDCIYHNYTPSYIFKNYKNNINNKLYIYFYIFINDTYENNIYSILKEDSFFILDYPEIKLIGCFLYEKNNLNISFYNSNLIKNKININIKELYFSFIHIYFDYFFYAYYDNYIENYTKYTIFKDKFKKFLILINNDFYDIITSQKLKKICLRKNIEFKRKNDGFYIRSKK